MERDFDKVFRIGLLRNKFVTNASSITNMEEAIEDFKKYINEGYAFLECDSNNGDYTNVPVDIQNVIAKIVDIDTDAIYVKIPNNVFIDKNAIYDTLSNTSCFAAIRCFTYNVNYKPCIHRIVSFILKIIPSDVLPKT